MKNKSRNDLEILGYVFTVFGTIVQFIIMSQVFYEYAGKLAGYVNNIIIAYAIGLYAIVLMVAIGVYGYIKGNYGSLDDKNFEDQMQIFVRLANKSRLRKTIWSFELVIDVVAISSCIMLVKWFVGIALLLVIISNIIFLSLSYIFVDKYKDRIDRLSVVEVKAVKKSKKQIEEENPIVQRLKSIG